MTSRGYTRWHAAPSLVGAELWQRVLKYSSSGFMALVQPYSRKLFVIYGPHNFRDLDGLSFVKKQALSI